MSGEEIIKRINEIKLLIVRDPGGRKQALLKCDYLIDDIYMYKSQSL
jgi:hypothetical protein